MLAHGTDLLVVQLRMPTTTDLYNGPDAIRPIHFLSDREDSQAYHLK